jgi:hypothetical protein
MEYRVRRRPIGPVSRSKSKKVRLLRSLVLDGHIRRPLINLYLPFTLGLLEELEPSMSDYFQVSEMMHVMHMGDTEQAALSICSYARAAMRLTVTQADSGQQG